MTGYSKKSLILRRQDADDQKRKLTCLILFGPLLNREVDPSSSSNFLSSVLTTRTGVKVNAEDLAFSEIKTSGEERRSAFIRWTLFISDSDQYFLLLQVPQPRAEAGSLGQESCCQEAESVPGGVADRPQGEAV